MNCITIPLCYITGVRGCKVVLTCVTTKYSLSANCRREVSLADALKKPIVPLLLDKITWPPEGPMSMVFTQLLYINFCKPDISVQDTWDCPQMEELLSKMNAHIPSMVNSAKEKDNKVVESKTKKKEASPSAPIEENVQENHANGTSSKQGNNSPKPQSDNNQSPQSKEPNKKSSSCILL